MSSDCQAFSENAAKELAQSFAVNTLMKDLGPYAQMAMFTAQARGGAGLGGTGGMGGGGGCGFAQGYFSQNNLNGQGGLPADARKGGVMSGGMVRTGSA
ncbi:hypothetical protein HY994_05125 [Candidatus Micrarchaeota archaeon]|nr:hypothetical protein [Candidatus Micrarchaeota archaeon]